MKNLLRASAFAMLVASVCGASSCSNEKDTSDSYYVADGRYSGMCTLSALGDTVSYGNSVTVENRGTKICIDSISYRNFNVKKFVLDSLRCVSKDGVASITIADKGRIVSAGGMRFEINNVNAEIKGLNGDFQFLIHPMGMPGEGFLLTLVGKGE